MNIVKYSKQVHMARSKLVDYFTIFIQLRNDFHFSDVHGAMNHSGSRAK